MGKLRNGNVIGRNVARFRYQAGWSQEVLAAKMQLLGCYMTRAIIANIESRRSAVTDKQIVFFAEVFGVEAGEFFPRMRPSSRSKCLIWGA
jgi:transcriptional regulator with XRE-family HTH domain